MGYERKIVVFESQSFNGTGTRYGIAQSASFISTRANRECPMMFDGTWLKATYRVVTVASNVKNMGIWVDNGAGIVMIVTYVSNEVGIRDSVGTQDFNENDNCAITKSESPQTSHDVTHIAIGRYTS